MVYTEIDAIKAGEVSKLPANVAAILDFVDQTVSVGQVTDASFESVRLLFEPRDIATVILLVGHYMMVARFTAILGIELDAKPDDWTKEH